MKTQQFLIKKFYRWIFSWQQGLESGSGSVLDPNPVCHVRLDFDPELANIGSDNAGMSKRGKGRYVPTTKNGSVQYWWDKCACLYIFIISDYQYASLWSYFCAHELYYMHIHTC